MSIRLSEILIYGNNFYHHLEILVINVEENKSPLR